MDATTTDPIGASLKRMNALLAWWGIPKISSVDATTHEIRRFQDFAADLQSLYGDAAGLQVKTLLTTNDGITRALCQLLQQRRPQDLLAAESKLIVSVLEAAALQAKTWIDISQQINARCAVFARETATDRQALKTSVSEPETSVSR